LCSDVSFGEERSDDMLSLSLFGICLLDLYVKGSAIVDVWNFKKAMHDILPRFTLGRSYKFMVVRTRYLAKLNGPRQRLGSEVTFDVIGFCERSR